MKVRFPKRVHATGTKGARSGERMGNKSGDNMGAAGASQILNSGDEMGAKAPRLPEMSAVANAMRDPKLFDLPQTYAAFRKKMQSLKGQERTLATALLKSLDRTLAHLGDLSSVMATGTKTGRFAMTATATVAIAKRAKKVEALTGDVHIQEIRNACRTAKFSSEMSGKIVRLCQKIADAYDKASWAGEDDWPFYATAVIDTIYNEGAEPTLKMVQDHFKTEMSKSLKDG